MLRRRLTFSNVVAFLALFVALSAGSYAAIKIPANSVGSKQLKSKAVTNKKLGNNAVSSSKIASDAIDSSKVRNGSLSGEDINVTGFPKVPLAGTADFAGISRVKIVSATGTSRADTGNGPIDSATAVCDQGLFVVGGGVSVSDVSNQFASDSFPNGNSGWSAHVANFSAATPTFTVFAICAPVGSTQ